jgi:hypothetical protein
MQRLPRLFDCLAPGARGRLPEQPHARIPGSAAQIVPEEVRAAYRELKAQGFTQQLLAGED